MDKDDIEATLIRARALVAASDLDGAEPLATRLTQDASEDPPGWELCGWIALVRGRLAEAQEHLRRALALGLNDARVHIQLAKVAVLLQDLDMADRHAATARELAGDDTGVLFLSAEIADLRNEGEQAVTHMRRFVLLAPNEAEGHRRLAAYSANLGDLAGALAAVIRARSLGRDDAFFAVIEAAHGRLVAGSSWSR